MTERCAVVGIGQTKYARRLLPVHGIACADHVLIGREGGIERDFALLREELIAALARATAGKGDPPRRRKPPVK